MTLTLVPAGAGAGKSYRIEKTLAEWVEAGTVAPGRILAVTFTESAATELRERIRSELLRRGRLDDALEIDRAYVGTIHGLGQRLLTEHAFAAGRNPTSRLITEPERDLMIRREMARCQALAPVLRDVGRFGYAWSYSSDASAEEQFRNDLLGVIDLLRGLGERGQCPAILEAALEDLGAGYGHTGDGAALTAALERAVGNLLDQFPDGLSDAPNPTAEKAFRSDHQRLRRAAGGALHRDWKLWQGLRTLRTSKRGAPTPSGYDDLAHAVMEAAEGLLTHPGPLEDARTHLTALVQGAQQVLEAYDAAKRAAGLIDYADMIVETEALLRTNPQVLAAVLTEIDCVVIDEFQDTNPVQFAMLWRLASGAGHALIVGDTKQSIMGFQGADARLSTALIEAHPDATDPLDRNWRSDPRIMEFVNAVGPYLFPGGYDALSPTREATGTTALEALVLKGTRTTPAPETIADRIDTLLTGEQVWDKTTGALRHARPEDIAVLCYRHADAAKVAGVLSTRGHPVRIQSEGWLTAPPVRAARAALGVVADPDDLHAALTFLTLGPPAVPLEDALRMAVDGALDHTALDALRGLNTLVDRHPVADLLMRTLAEGGLTDWAAGLADPAQALADLARLLGEAQGFDVLDDDLRTAAGFHGAGPQVFLGWIIAQTERSWNTHPDPAGWSGTGIEICTWHAAKGREWPITVVAGLDMKIAERPGTLRAHFDGFDDLGNVLDRAGLRWLPDLAAPEKQKVFADALILDDEANAARALYVALTRARDRLILAMPPHKAKERSETMGALLRDRTGLVIEDGALMVAGQRFPARIIEAVPPEEIVAVAPPRATVPQYGLPRAMPEAFRTPWRTQPSSAEGLLEIRAEHMPLGVGISTRRTKDAVAQGTAWHLALRTLMAQCGSTDRIAEATGLGASTLAQIADQAANLRAWLADQGYPTLHLEVPLQQLRPDGSATNAVIDCLAEGPESFLIIDHKSGRCADPDARFAEYSGQLDAYRMLVPGILGKPVRAVAIHWMGEGLISVAHLPVQVDAWPRWSIEETSRSRVFD